MLEARLWREDRTDRLDIVPAQLRVIVTVRPKYACRTCTDGVTRAPTPAWLIEGGLPTEGAIAHVPPLGRFGFAKSPAGQRVSKFEGDRRASGAA